MPSPALAYPLAALYGVAWAICGFGCVAVALAFLLPLGVAALTLMPNPGVAPTLQRARSVDQPAA